MCSGEIYMQKIISPAGLIAAAMLAGTASPQLPLNDCPLPKNRDSMPLAEFSSPIALPGNNLSYTAAKYNDYAATLLLNRSPAGRGLRPSPGFGEARQVRRSSTPDSAPASARFWTMTPVQKRVGLFMRAVPRLKQIFADEGVPEHLVWLAEVESAFDHNAESRSGAVGLFQLMPDTAMRFGLQLKPLDERKLPEKSARAAAQYLKQLHRQFRCWQLALAAYNAGEGLVERTMEDYNLTTFAELAPYLPDETRSYVPRVFAVANSREGRPMELSRL